MIFPAVRGHQQQKQHNDQISGIKIAGENLPKKRSNRVIWRGFTGLRRPFGGIVAWGWIRYHRRRWGRIRMYGSRRGFVPAWVRNAIAAVGAVRLRDITVIHGITFRKDENGALLRQSLPFLQPAWLAPACGFDRGSGMERGHLKGPADSCRCRWSRPSG